MALSERSGRRVGRRLPLLAVATLCAGLGLAGASIPAHAQLFGFWPWENPADTGIGPGEVQRILQAHGMRLLTTPYRNDSVYVADVIDPRGLQERVLIDAYRGAIVQRYRVGPVSPHYASRNTVPWPDPGESWVRRPFGDESVPIPPRPVPGGLVPDVTAREPADEGAEPGVVPGIGPEQPRPRAKHPAHPKALARSTPAPKPDNTAAPENGTTAPSGEAKPAGNGGATANPPPPAPSQAEKVTAPAAPSPSPQPPAKTAQPAPQGAAPTVAARSPATSTPPTATAKPAAPSKKAPLNDIPPAPLD